MKQIRFTAVLLVLLLAFTACSSTGSVSPTTSASAAREITEPSAAETEPAESAAPETEAGETEAPETEAPETEAPESEPAETRPMESAAPETEPAETEAPATEPAEIEAPETETPETEPAETEPAETEPAETEPAETEPAETEPAETEPVETEPAETEPAETEPVETEPEAEPQVRYTGTVENNVYTNEYLNLRFEPSSVWTFYNEDEIAMINNITAKLVEEGDIQTAIEQSGQYMDMYASDSMTYMTANLVIQPMNPLLAVLSDEELYVLSEAEIEKQFAEAGVELKEIELSDVQFCGETVKGLRIVLNIFGIDMEEYQIWIRTGGEYMGLLTVAGMNEGDAVSVFDYFSKLN